MTPKQQLDKIRLNCELPLTASPFSRFFDPALSMAMTPCAGPLQETDYFNQRLQRSIAQTERSPD